MLNGRRIVRSTLVVMGVLACTFGVEAAEPVVAAPASPSAFSSVANPYAQHVVAVSNRGLEDKAVDVGALGGGMYGLSFGGGGGEPGKLRLDIPDISTTGLLCQILTLQPAQGCLETQLSKCTSQSWCTSNTSDKCTTGTWCTIAAQCTNTSGCTDAGQCTQANGCTGTAHCTEGSGCTQSSSCTNGNFCTNDQGTCTGGAQCTASSGCTNGANCTGGSGCTADAQCTDGPSCTGGTNCTSGTHCTSGTGCQGGPTKEHEAALTAFSPFGLDSTLEAPGAPRPDLEPHFAPTTKTASLGWLALLALPALVRRRRTADSCG